MQQCVPGTTFVVCTGGGTAPRPTTRMCCCVACVCMKCVRCAVQQQHRYDHRFTQRQHLYFFFLIWRDCRIPFRPATDLQEDIVDLCNVEPYRAVNARKNLGDPEKQKNYNCISLLSAFHTQPARQTRTHNTQQRHPEATKSFSFQGCQRALPKLGTAAREVRKRHGGGDVAATSIVILYGQNFKHIVEHCWCLFHTQIYSAATIQRPRIVWRRHLWLLFMDSRQRCSALCWAPFRPATSTATAARGWG